jgi:hypothetical protein
VSLLLTALFAAILSSPCCAEDNLIFYSTGKRDPAASSALRDYFSSKRYALSFYQGDGSMERHFERVNRINASKSGALVAIEIMFGEEKHVMVAMADLGKDSQASAKTGGRRRLLWAVDELPAKHEAQSKQLAELVAAQFGVKVKKVPLFPLIGVDMPGIFVSIECGREEARSLLAKLDAALQKYYRRDRL